MKNSYFKHLLLSTIFLFTFLHHSFSQEQHCGLTEAMNALYKLHPELIQQEADYNAMIQQKIANKALHRTTAEDVYVIPVVFHIIHTNGPENISDAQIQDQMNILNTDYRKLNADLSKVIRNTPFDTLAADIKLEFRLAQLDPKGNCTNGIDRIYSSLTNNADNNSKLNPWPRDKYMNVWVVSSIGTTGNVAGYAYYPSAVSSPALASIDGILILSSYIGSIGTSNKNQSRALTHEIGHYLNLIHVWGNTNAPEVDCSGSDLVEDTPLTRGHLTCDNKPYCTVYNFINTVYKFPAVTTTSGSIDPSAPPVNNGATFGKPKAVGVSDNSSENARFSFSKWDIGGAKINHDSIYDSLSGSININKYYEVTIGPKYGHSFTLTKLAFLFKRDSLGARTFCVRSSMDNFKNNLTASLDSSNTGLVVKPGNIFFSKYDATNLLNGSVIKLSSIKDSLGPVTFRIYGWNAEDSTGTFGIDSLVFSGTSGLIENTQNYMDYSYCSIMFTKGQKDRMRAALETTVASRSNLWTTANLIATGTNGNGSLCKPTADFNTSDLSIICPNNLLTFKSNIQNTTPGSPVSLLWEFEGGTPSTSTDVNPVVKYTTEGYYNVKLTATNAAGSSTIERLDYVCVRPSWGDATVGAGITEGFENTTDGYYAWHMVDYGSNNNTWKITNAGYNSKRSMYINAFQNMPSDLDALITPYYNVYLFKDLTMTFKYTSASRATLAADMNDQLTVYYSINCGSTWTIALILKGTDLITSGGNQANNYVPTLASQWQTKSVKVNFYNPANDRIVFKFEYKTGVKSNNIYIDDINLSGTVGIDENEISAENAVIYPNPTSDLTKVSYHLNHAEPVSLELIDILGKQITLINQGVQTEGDFSIDLSKEKLKLKSGVYFIKLNVGKASVTHKLIITE